MRTTNPWHITDVFAANNGGVHVILYNEFTEERTSWQLNHYSFQDPRFVGKRFDFAGATWHQGARRAFLNLVARARRGRGLSARFIRPGELGLD